MDRSPRAPTPADPWVQVDDIGPEALGALLRALAEVRLPPGAAVFGLRSGDGHTLFLLGAALPVADAVGLPARRLSAPPPDDPRLRLLAGAPGAWRHVVRPLT